MELFGINTTIIDLEDSFEEKETYDGFYETNIEKLISHLNYDQYDRFFIMKQIFKQLNMSNEEVYIAYIVKNCLNKFRQDNGYKQGFYIKDWKGKEDNVVAYKIAKEWGATEALFDNLYDDLTVYYNEEILTKGNENV